LRCDVSAKHTDCLSRGARISSAHQSEKNSEENEPNTQKCNITKVQTRQSNIRSKKSRSDV